MRPAQMREAPLAGGAFAEAHETKRSDSTARTEPSFIFALLQAGAERPFNPLPLRTLPARWRAHFAICHAEFARLMIQRQSTDEWRAHFDAELQRLARQEGRP